MTDYVIEIENLTRYFGRKRAVNQLTLKIPQGGIFSLIGPNGSGKTTTLRMLLGLLPPTRGTSKVFGENSMQLRSETRARIGYLTEEHSFIDWMTLKECARFQASFYPNWNTSLFEKMMAHYQFDMSLKGKKLSRGEKAGFSLALILATDPDLLILDDPSLGLDVMRQHDLLDTIVSFSEDPTKTVLFTTHNLAHLERVAERFAVIDQGVLRANSNLEHFLQHIDYWIVDFSKTNPDFSNVPRVIHAQEFDGHYHLTIVNKTPTIINQLKAAGAVRWTPAQLNFEQAMKNYLMQGTQSLMSVVGETV